MGWRGVRGTQMEARRAELVERVADSDEVLGEAFLMEEPIEAAELKAAIRRQARTYRLTPHQRGRGRGTRVGTRMGGSCSPIERR